MTVLNQQFVVDEKGNRTGVILSIDQYRKILENLEEFESIRAYDAAKASADETVSFSQAVREIEDTRK